MMCPRTRLGRYPAVHPLQDITVVSLEQAVAALAAQHDVEFLPPPEG